MPSFDRTALHDLTLARILENHTGGARACYSHLRVCILTIRSGVVLLRSFGGAFGWCLAFIPFIGQANAWLYLLVNRAIRLRS
jgi:hypothetical protein